MTAFILFFNATIRRLFTLFANWDCWYFFHVFYSFWYEKPLYHKPKL